MPLSNQHYIRFVILCERSHEANETCNFTPNNIVREAVQPLNSRIRPETNSRHKPSRAWHPIMFMACKFRVSHNTSSQNRGEISFASSTPQPLRRTASLSIKIYFLHNFDFEDVPGHATFGLVTTRKTYKTAPVITAGHS